MVCYTHIFCVCNEHVYAICVNFCILCGKCSFVYRRSVSTRLPKVCSPKFKESSIVKWWELIYFNFRVVYTYLACEFSSNLSVYSTVKNLLTRIKRVVADKSSVLRTNFFFYFYQNRPALHHSHQSLALGISIFLILLIAYFTPIDVYFLCFHVFWIVIFLIMSTGDSDESCEDWRH